MNILAIVVIYNPNIIALQENIRSFYKDVRQLIIWDNSNSENGTHDYTMIPLLFPEAIYLKQEENKGISKALNYAWKYARERDYDTLLTMDQDSKFVAFKLYIDNDKAWWKSNGCCLCGPTPNLAAEPSPYSSFEKVSDVITSGMLVPIRLLEIAGGYNEDFFVDGIDIDLCINLRKKGYDTYQDLGSSLIQNYGIPLRKNILGKDIFITYYPSDRICQIFRNHIIILRKYSYPRDLLKKIFKRYFIGIYLKSAIFVRKNRFTNLIAIIKGIYQGFTYK